MRRRLVALYAVHYEIMRVRFAAREPGIAAIRLAWWRDALEAVHDGAPAPSHPVLQAYAQAGAAGAAHWRELIEAEGAVLGGPFASWEAAEAYLEHTTVALFRLGLGACGVAEADIAPAFLRYAALCWGHVFLARTRSTLLPGGVADCLARARSAYAELGSRARALPHAAFPALGYLALAPAYIKALRTGARGPLLIARQFTLVRAAATGRL